MTSPRARAAAGRIRTGGSGSRSASWRSDLRPLFRFLWRHRAQLYPLWLGLALALSATVLHIAWRSWWPLPALVGINAAALVWYAGEAMSNRARGLVAALVPAWLDEGKRGVLDRPTERAYLSALLGVSGAWLSWAVHSGATTWVVRTLLIGLLVATVPWLWHRRIRRGGRLSRYHRRWPVVADNVAMFRGSAVTRADSTSRVAVVLRVKLRPGLTVDHVGAFAGQVASALGRLRPGSITISGDPASARHVLVRIVPRDPWADKIDHPMPTPGSRSAAWPLVMGRFDDGTDATYRIQHTLVVGQSGSGKSVWLESLMVHVLACDNAVLVGADLAAGATLGPWEPALAAPLATTPDEAWILLQGVLALVEYRERTLAADKREGAGTDAVAPTPGVPWVVVVLDEFPDLVAAGGRPVIALLGRIAKKARKAGVWLVLGAQNGTKADLGSTELRGQLSATVGLRLDNQQSRVVWGDARRAGWDGTILPTGVYLLRDAEHGAPRQAKGLWVGRRERATAIRQASRGIGAGVLDQGSEQALWGDPVDQTVADDAATADTVPLPVIQPPEPDESDTQPTQQDADSPAHSAPQTPAQTAAPDLSVQVLEVLRAAGPAGMQPAQLAKATDSSIDQANRALRKLAQGGKVHRPSYGQWAALTSQHPG